MQTPITKRWEFWLQDPSLNSRLDLGWHSITFVYNVGWCFSDYSFN